MLLQDSASDAYDAASQAAHDATREPTLYEKAKGKLSPPSTADKVKAGAADAYAQAKVRLSGDSLCIWLMQLNTASP